MTAIRLRLPEWLHNSARQLAEKEKVSLNQLIALALAEKVSALMTEDYLAERAKRGSRKKFRRVLARVPEVEPKERDRLSASKGANAKAFRRVLAKAPDVEPADERDRI